MTPLALTLAVTAGFAAGWTAHLLTSTESRSFRAFLRTLAWADVAVVHATLGVVAFGVVTASWRWVLG